MTYFLSKLTKSLSFEDSSCGLSGTAAVGGVDRVGVDGLEFGLDETGVVTAGVDVEEAEVMIGSSAQEFVSSLLRSRRTGTETSSD